ncbi:hypothetical protein F2P81_002367 [Scophthalmus maximus]|uniref:Uncharacterized protein n=1 Tax=Scophthalmus maximus TaxID=52904 RepID=A0A6A4TN85_SCOMX|nr:hypothetical protein F2P81_002367 [Scophthalmus maximus]
MLDLVVSLPLALTDRHHPHDRLRVRRLHYHGYVIVGGSFVLRFETPDARVLLPPLLSCFKEPRRAAPRGSTHSYSTDPFLSATKPWHSVYRNAALHSELYLTPWQTSTAIRAARSNSDSLNFRIKFDIGPKPIPWL